MSNYCLEVKRKNLNELRVSVLESPEAIPLSTNQVLLEVEKFALTANNVTYGVAGDVLGYWNFFPTENGWGRVPAWGIGRVVRSNSASLKEGDRYYGYFPMASHLIVDLGNDASDSVSDADFYDMSAHRQSLSRFYNQYLKVEKSLGFDPAFDDHQMIYRPLFTTAFVLQDYLSVNDFFSASTVCLGSASSKTALGIAFMLGKKSPAINVVGLTSSTNEEFVRSTGLYSEVVCYEDIESKLDASAKYGFVDMSGDQRIVNIMRNHMRDNLTLHLGVGASHWDSLAGVEPSSLGPEKVSFFAPSEIDSRIQSWGSESFYQQLGEAWQDFLLNVDGWVAIEYAYGAEQLKATFEELLGGLHPSKAVVVKA